MERKYLPWVASLGTWTEYKDNKVNEKDIHPYANVGIVEARGFDGNFSFRHKIDKVDLTIRGNMTYTGIRCRKVIGLIKLWGWLH